MLHQSLQSIGKVIHQPILSVSMCLTHIHTRFLRVDKRRFWVECIWPSVGNAFNSKCMKNVHLSHHVIWWRFLLCALFLSICVDGVVKAHDVFSPSPWTDYSITFRINYPPLPKSLSLPLQVQGLWSGSIRPVQNGQFTDLLHQLTHSEVENKIQHVRIQKQIVTLCINKSVFI